MNAGGNVLTGAAKEGYHRPFSCNICNQSYSRLDHLSRHVRSHSQEKPFACTICRKDFARTDLLSRHRMTHETRSKSLHTPTRSRTFQACVCCAEAKLRCVGGQPCQRCQQKQLYCQFATPRPRGRKARGPVSHIVEGEVLLDAVSTGSLNGHDDVSPQFAEHLVFAHDEILNADSTSGNSSQDGFDIAVDGQVRAINDQAELPNTTASNTTWGHKPVTAGPRRNDILHDKSTGDGESLVRPFLQNDLLDSIGGTNPFLSGIDDLLLQDFLSDIPKSLFGFDDEYLEQGSNSFTTSVAHNCSRLVTQAFSESVWHWVPTKGDGKEYLANLSLPLGDLVAKTKPTRIEPQWPSLDMASRDRILAMILGFCDGGDTMSAFPSSELLTNLISNFLDHHESLTDSWLHIPTFNSNEESKEMLLSIVAAGAVLSTIPALLKFGFALQEVGREASTKAFESDTRNSRCLRPLQGNSLLTDIGLWSDDRRKMEISEATAQIVITMMRRAGWFQSPSLSSNSPQAEDDMEITETKWRQWVERESQKRLAFHVMIRDAQASSAFLTQPLISYSEVDVSLPWSRELWTAKTAEEWKEIYLSKFSGTNGQLPSIRTCLNDSSVISSVQNLLDIPLVVQILLSRLWTLSWQYKEMAKIMKLTSNNITSNSALVLSSYYQDIVNRLQHFKIVASEWGGGLNPCASLLYQYQLMTLHVSLQDVELLAGKGSEDEVRRIYPFLKEWVAHQDARTTVWHAGQVFRAAKRYPSSTLRGSDAIAIYHAGIVFWAFTVLSRTEYLEEGCQAQSCLMAQPFLDADTIGPEVVYLDGDGGPALDRFLILGKGQPAIVPSRSSTDNDMDGSQVAAPLSDIGRVMKAIMHLLQKGYENDKDACPPLARNLGRLLQSLGNASCQLHYP